MRANPPCVSETLAHALFWLTSEHGRQVSTRTAQQRPLPNYEQEIDLQATPSLRQAHVIAQKVESAVLLYYRDVTSHSWRDTTHFNSGVPKLGGFCGKAQIKRRLMRIIVQAEFTFAVKRTFHKRNSCKERSTTVLSQQTGRGDSLPNQEVPIQQMGRGDLLHSQELGTLYALPLRYMMMCFTEGEPLQAMKEESYRQAQAAPTCMAFPTISLAYQKARTRIMAHSLPFP